MTLFRSLRARLTLLFTCTATGVLLLIGAVALSFAAQAARRNAEHVLAISARRVRAEIAEEKGAGDRTELAREENELLERADGVIVVLDREGRLMARSRRDGPAWPRSGDDGWLVEAIATPQGPVLVALPWWKTRAVLWNQATMLAGMLVCVALITAAGGWLIVGQALRPIRLLARRAEAVSTENLRVRLEAPSTDTELVELVETFNRLLDRLTQTTLARGRFYAAASHELRTPLQALSGHLELALTRPRTSAEYRVFVGEAFSQTRRLVRLVQELLLLNQLHQRTSQPPREPVDLTEVVLRLLVQHAAALTARGLTVEELLPNTAEIEAPLPHAEIILRNLVENAVKYAVAGTSIRVQLTREALAWVFEIYNYCPPELEVRPAQVFEPFFRPDASRCSNTGGNGLGLGLCKALADANGWSLEWSREIGGVRARVLFPAEVPPPASARREGDVCGTAMASR